MDYTIVSAQTGSAGMTLQNFIDWYLGGSPFLTDGEWFASIAEIESGEVTGGAL